MESLPPPPDTIPHNVIPKKVEEPSRMASKLLPLARRGLGTKGLKIQLVANHFRVRVDKDDGYYYHYSVAMSYEDGHPVEMKGIGRKVIDKLCETYRGVFPNKCFAYDGEKSLFTVDSLAQNKNEFVVVLEEISAKRVGRNGSPGSPSDGGRKRLKHQSGSKTIKVDLNYATKIPKQAIANALRGQDSEQFQEALRVLDIILRQNAAKQGCLLVRQSFFHDIQKNYIDTGSGVQGVRGFHSSFRATQGGLSLNVDVSTTMVVKPGPVIAFLCFNQNLHQEDPHLINWTKAKRTLKNLRIKANGLENKITGLSEDTCRKQKFSLKHGKDANGEALSKEITVYEYFKHHKKIDLRHPDMPCINIGKPKRPTYFPVELCTLIPLQRYTKALTNLQRVKLVENSRQRPQDRKKSLQDSLSASRYGNEPMLRESGITVEPNFIKVEARVLQAPKLVVGGGANIFPRNGRWNFNDKKLVKPVTIENWAVVNFSAKCDIRHLLNVIRTCSIKKGMNFLNGPYKVFEEENTHRDKKPVFRVDEMYDKVKKGLPRPPQLLLCILPEKKNSELYGPWKKKNLADEGVVTQCIAPTKINDQYITNVLLKINAKLGGMNSFLSIEHARTIPLVSHVPTLILGMDVSHGSPGRSDVPSIAAVVSSRGWPEISRYRAAVRTQSSKVEMVSSLFKPVSDSEDDGIIRELLQDFIDSSSGVKPQQIIIFRDGVSESQFNQVLNIELDEIIKACKYLDETWDPKFTFIVAQKNHHTRFFHENNAPDNVPPGTVIDNGVCHPKNNDFYMCAHNGMIGTSRPTHYHVLHDEIGFSADALQELVHSLSYVYQRSTTAISVVAPICYAHLAAAQMGQFMKFDDFSETSSSHGGLTSAAPVPVPQLPRLHKRVVNSMFFC